MVKLPYLDIDTDVQKLVAAQVSTGSERKLAKIVEALEGIGVEIRGFTKVKVGMLEGTDVPLVLYVYEP